MNKKLLFWIQSFAILGLIFTFSTTSFAIDDGATRTHSIGSMSRTGFNNLHGGYIYSTVPDVTSNWSSAANKRFVQKGMWVTIDGDPNNWIESGYREGAKYNLEYMKGFYMAYRVVTSGVETYSERSVPFGPTATVGTGYNHKTIYLGDSVLYWRSTIDESYAWDVYGWAGDGSHDAGFETDTSVGHINTTNAITNMQYYEDGTWYPWTSSATFTNNDPYATGFTGSFTTPSHTAATFTEY